MESEVEAPRWSYTVAKLTCCKHYFSSLAPLLEILIDGLLREVFAPSIVIRQYFLWFIRPRIQKIN